MTKELFQAIRVYASKPSGFNRERGMTLIAEGHLEPVEVERLEWALKAYREKVAKAT